jgi:hypothetical protein
MGGLRWGRWSGAISLSAGDRAQRGERAGRYTHRGSRILHGAWLLFVVASPGRLPKIPRRCPTTA